MRHCTAYKCNMCGSNHREESDRRPILLCPECQAKVCWALKIEPVQRYRKLSEFFGKNDFPQQHAFCEQAIRILTHNNKSAP